MTTEAIDTYQGEIRIDWTEFRSTISYARTIAIFGHIRPDGDTIGSALALRRAFEKLGKRVLNVSGHEVPPTLKFLDPFGKIRVVSDMSREERAFVESADVVVIVDVSSWQQLGPDAAELVKSARGRVVVIDHHAVGDEIGVERYVENRADSAGSVVFEALKALGVDFELEIAFPLFVAIASDTGWFRFGATKARTFERAAELVESGVKVDLAYRLLNEQETFGRFKLIGALATNCRRFLEGKGVFMSLSRRDFDAAGAATSDSEDLVNLPLSVAGMEVAVIAIEQPDGTVKASFRSRCDLDCSQLAREFGGGGHKRAAGASPKGDLATASKALIEKTTEYYNALSNFNRPAEPNTPPNAQPQTNSPQSNRPRPNYEATLGDITEFDGDAIVNAANTTLLGGGGVDGAIHRAAGPQLKEFCRTLGGAKTGEAKLTPGFNLRAKYVIHVPGPVFIFHTPRESDRLLRESYQNALRVAESVGARSVAFPSISTGAYRFPLNRAAQIVAEVFEEYAQNPNSTIERVVMVCFDRKTLDAYERAFESVRNRS